MRPYSQDHLSRLLGAAACGDLGDCSLWPDDQTLAVLEEAGLA